MKTYVMTLKEIPRQVREERDSSAKFVQMHEVSKRENSNPV